MAFSSMPFLCVFLPLGFLLYALMPTLRAKNAVLVGISLLFYAYGEPVYVLLMIVCVFGNYLLARAFPGRPEKSKKALLGVGVVLNLGMLAFYKYTGMLLETVNVLTGLSLPAVSIRLPIGISFFTFQALSYVIDVYRGKAEAEKSFFKVLLYISFFPQLIAGPIVKYADIAHQIDDRTQTPQNTALGLRRFIVGLSKKVLISNTMGAAADYVYALPAAELSMAAGWIGAVSYMLQIYFDFSGYSDMAIGLGRMFGFSIKENFDHPYIAASMQDFWRRWHISLTGWFREYLYIPLGGNRKGKTRTWINRLLVFFCTGLWHGANWTFVLWGLYHGLFLTLETIFPRKGKKSLFGHLYVLLVVCVGFVLFRSDSVGQAGRMLAAMFTGVMFNAGVAAAATAPLNGLFFAALAAAVIGSLPVGDWARRRLGQRSWTRPLSYAASVLLLVLCLLSLSGGTYNPFIYFRF